MMSLFRAMAAVGCVTAMVEGALRSRHSGSWVGHSGSWVGGIEARVSPPVLGMMMRDAEEQWVSSYRGALNGTANSSEALTEVRSSCVRTAFVMVDSVKGHKNGLQKRMKTVCNPSGNADALCDHFSSGLLAIVSDDPTQNVEGKLDGEIGSFCGHFIESIVRATAEARNQAAQDHINKVHDRQNRIAATMKVVAKAQEEVKKAQKAQQAELKVSKPLAKKHQKPAPTHAPADPEEQKKRENKKKQEAAEKEGGAKGLAAELAREEEADNKLKTQVVNDALAVETDKDEPLPKKHSEEDEEEES